jgi:hypothetical protein
MSSNETSFSSLERVIADVGLWKKEVRAAGTPLTPDDLAAWLKSELINNVAPFFESLGKAVIGEFAEQAEILVGQAGALEELIDREGDFLQPEMASDLIATYQIGLAIVEILEIEKVVLPNELKNKQLRDLVKLYKTNTAILLEQIVAITNDEDEDDDNDDIHGQSEDSEGAIGRGESGSDGDGRGDGGDGGRRGGDGGRGDGGRATAENYEWPIPDGLEHEGEDEDADEEEGV